MSDHIALRDEMTDAGTTWISRQPNRDIGKVQAASAAMSAAAVRPTPRAEEGRSGSIPSEQRERSFHSIPRRHMNMPVRIQRKRTKGWRMPEGAVYVGRGTPFGNPVVCTPHGCETKPCGCCPEYRCCVKVYREFVTSGLEGRPSTTGSFAIACDAMAGYPRRTNLIEALPRLRGKDLACWCALDKPCHADVLLELANSEGT